MQITCQDSNPRSKTTHKPPSDRTINHSTQCHHYAPAHFTSQNLRFCELASCSPPPYAHVDPSPPIPPPGPTTQNHIRPNTTLRQAGSLACRLARSIRRRDGRTFGSTGFGAHCLWAWLDMHISRTPREFLSPISLGWGLGFPAANSARIRRGSKREGKNNCGNLFYTD